jgi:dTMP kinase
MNGKLHLGKGRGLFIVVEGGDGVGKTTVVNYIHDYLLNSLRYATVCTKDPGGSEWAMLARGLLFNDKTKETSNTVQALQFSAARLDMVEKTIKPALDEGCVVVCDRFYLTMLAYQRQAQNMDQIVNIGCANVHPMITLILDASPETAVARTANRQTEGGEINWLDKIGLEERAARRQVFLDYAIKNPLTAHVINADMSKTRVQEEVLHWMSKTVLPVLSKRLQMSNEESGA